MVRKRSAPLPLPLLSAEELAERRAYLEVLDRLTISLPPADSAREQRDKVADRCDRYALRLEGEIAGEADVILARVKRLVMVGLRRRAADLREWGAES